MQTSAQLFDQGFFFKKIKNKLRPPFEGINFLDQGFKDGRRIDMV